MLLASPTFFLPNEDGDGSISINVNPFTTSGTDPRMGMFWDGFQWIPSEQSVSSAAQAAQQKLKRLYVGNVPPGINDEIFKQAFIPKLRETEIIPATRDSESLSRNMLIWYSSLFLLLFVPSFFMYIVLSRSPSSSESMSPLQYESLQLQLQLPMPETTGCIRSKGMGSYRWRVSRWRKRS